ncbi:MAG: restriction endonuclease subunit S [Paraprevotella sp.]|nr:restriction endonuclease subunit S [Paraprevotella sp.]
MKLKDICQYVSERVATVTLTTSNYISTENMLPDKGGVVVAGGVPTGNAVEFAAGDVLVSNIRPYLKKIWQADKKGGCSADVLCFRTNKNVDCKYFYYLLSQQSFFDYMMSGSKGCKMPRGDKKQIMQWSFDLPSLEDQKRIAGILSSLDSKIELNRRINDNLTQAA